MLSGRSVGDTQQSLLDVESVKFGVLFPVSCMRRDIEPAATRAVVVYFTFHGGEF